MWHQQYDCRGDTGEPTGTGNVDDPAGKDRQRHGKRIGRKARPNRKVDAEPDTAAHGSAGKLITSSRARGAKFRLRHGDGRDGTPESFPNPSACVGT